MKHPVSLVRIIIAVGIWGICFWGPPASAMVQGRYVRVEDPTGWMMVWRQIEVFSVGSNVLPGHPDMFTGTVFPDHNIKTRDAVEITDGNKDTTARGVYFPAAASETEINPWFEIDLGGLTPIEKVTLYGADYPKRQWLDHGTRVISILDASRRVVWSSKWDYYDASRFAKGIFNFVPAAGEHNPLLGRIVPEGTRGWIPMGWLLGAQPAQRPNDATERMSRYAARNNPEEIAKLAARFFAVLDENVPGLAEAFRLHREGKEAEALESWKTYWFHKMEKLNSHRAPHWEYSSYLSQGEDLANGVMVMLSSRSPRAVQYVPGQIKWIDLPDRDDDPTFGNALSECEQKAQVGKVTRPLMEAYGRDPNPKYMIRWAEIMDDWALNFFDDAAKTPYEVENLFTFNPCNQWGVLMEDMSDLAVKHPEMINLIPASTLARVQLLCLEKYTTAWWRQDRYTTFIHISSGIVSWAIVLPYVSEFFIGQRASTEWRQSFERYMTMCTEPDGSPTDIGDEGHIEFAPQLGFPLAWLQAEGVKPEWLTPGWMNRFQQWDDNSYKYFFRHPAPGGYDHRDGVAYRPERWTSTTDHYTHAHVYPWKGPFPNRDEAIFSIPEVRRILDALGHISSGLPPALPGAEGVANAQKTSHDTIQNVLKGEKPGRPHILSDWMPYTGSYYFRGGWDENASFLSMLAPGSRGGSSSLYSGRPFYSTFTQYDYNFPMVTGNPVYVDGLPPQQLHGHFDTCRPGTKIDVLTYAEEKPAPFRWSSTNLFAFGESIFAGAYQNRPSFSDAADYRLKLDPEGPAVTGVRTARQILQLRHSRLFIVTDCSEITDRAPHDFSVEYKLAVSSRKGSGAVPTLAGQLEINPGATFLRTVNPEGPSTSLYQFSDQVVQYRKGPEAKPDFQGYAARLGNDVGIANQQVFAEVKHGTGLKLVSLISSREKGGIERVSFVEPIKRGDGSVGFHARLQDGGEIWYQSAGLNEGKLACGWFQGTGQALLVVREKEGFSGVLLGGKTLSFGNRPFSLSSGNVEFTLVGPAMTTNAIYSPIDPVSFSPNRNSFVESETVTMTSKTPQVEIHYTTDGTPPTLRSPVYMGPVKITESTEFAARAYRLGPNGKPLSGDDFEINGTKFSEPTYGWFYKKPYLEAAELVKDNLQPGLNYDYLESPWWRLYASAHWLPAAGSGVVERELDATKEAASEPYGMRYKGFIKIPRDGSYSFEAPHEFVYMDNDPGYDLRVYIDGVEWYLSQWWHGYGNWSVPLKQGYHRFEVDFADGRTSPWRKTGMWNYYPRPWVIHRGKPGDVLVSGPDLKLGRIPKEWLFHQR